jgi:periplasmic divalent cation tolerance protein
MNDTVFMVFCTAPGEEEATLIARTLIEKKLAACCNIIPAATSIYSWQGEIEEAKEALLLIKTTQKAYEQLEKEIKMIHNYAVPEIIAAKIETGSAAYFDWIFQNVERKG